MLKRIGVTEKLCDVRKKARKLTQKIPKPDLNTIIPPALGTDDHRRFCNPQEALCAWDDKQTQWWYFTGHLKTPEGRRFGYELVLFYRQTHLDYLAVVPSSLLTQKILVSHFAISDIDSLDPFQRFSYWDRGGFFDKRKGIASNEKFHIDVAGWSVFQKEDGVILIQASTGENGITLELMPTKPLCYHDQMGYSKRGSAKGIASFYCTYTRLETSGRLVRNGQIFEVLGSSWMDHEKLQVSSEAFIYGWNWCSLHLDNNEDLMVYLFKNSDGSIDYEHSFGTHINSKGVSRRIDSDDIEFKPLRYWQSPRTMGKYPVHNIIRIHSLECEIELFPLIQESELDVRLTSFVTYWEGAVDVRGKLRGNQVTGSGFLELAGYDKRPSTRLLHFMIIPEEL